MNMYTFILTLLLRRTTFMTVNNCGTILLTQHNIGPRFYCCNSVARLSPCCLMVEHESESFCNIAALFHSKYIVRCTCILGSALRHQFEHCHTTGYTYNYYILGIGAKCTCNASRTGMYKVCFWSSSQTEKHNKQG